MLSNKEYSGFFHKLHCNIIDGKIGLVGLEALYIGKNNKDEKKEYYIKQNKEEILEFTNKEK